MWGRWRGGQGWPQNGAGPTIPELREKFFDTFHGTGSYGLDEVYDVLSEVGFVKLENRWTREYLNLTLPPLPDAQFHVASGWTEQHGKLLNMARDREPQFQAAVETIENNLARDIKNRYAMEVTLVSARTLWHFSKVILGVGAVNEHVIQAEQAHLRGDDRTAIDHYLAVTQIIDGLLYEQRVLLDETTQVWNQSRYPKDSGHVQGGRRDFIWKVDRSNYYGNKTVDLSYIFEVEKMLGLFAYQQRLQQLMRTILTASGDH